MSKTVKGYKVFNNDWTCRGFKYKVGKTYTHKGRIGLCEGGFHFCTSMAECFNYYGFDPRNKIAEVIAHGKTISGDRKVVTDKLEIVREVSWEEMLTLANSGKGNTGLKNTGDNNSGDYNVGEENSGDYNVGEENSGDWNSGDDNSGSFNSGCYNSGNFNSGEANSGKFNSGDTNLGSNNSGRYNLGHGNSGDWNLSNRNSGYFNTENHKMLFFDKESDVTYEQWLKHKGRAIMASFTYYPTLWVHEDNMTDEEKEDHPYYVTTKGYLKYNPKTQKEAFQDYWDSLSTEDKEAVYSIPNFDAEKFELITGVDITE